MFWNGSGKTLKTLYKPGINNSLFTHLVKYIGPRWLVAPTGETLHSNGCNGLPPLDVIYDPLVHDEMHDVDMNYSAFSGATSYFNPLNYLSASVGLIQKGLTGFANFSNGVQVTHPDPARAYQYKGTIQYYVQLFSQMSVGQESDIKSFEKDYEFWSKTNSIEEGYVAYGASRGAALIFNALATGKFPGAELVVLEGCFSSIEDVIDKTWAPFESVARSVAGLFTQYRPDGLSPERSVDTFPEGVPVVFITAKNDKIVPASSTRNLANKLALRGKNDVYLLELDNCKHPKYMFSNKADRDKYETFMHAIYREYGLRYRSDLANQGQALMEEATMFKLDSGDLTLSI